MEELWQKLAMEIDHSDDKFDYLIESIIASLAFECDCDSMNIVDHRL